MKRLHKAQVPRNVLLGSAPLVVLLLFFAACGEAMTPVGPEMNAQSDALVAAKGGQPQVAVCHIPPGNPVDRHIITVGERAARAHLAHGDNLLDEVCPAPGVEFNGQCYILGGGDFAQAEQVDDSRGCRPLDGAHEKVGAAAEHRPVRVLGPRRQGLVEGGRSDVLAHEPRRLAAASATASMISW